MENNKQRRSDHAQQLMKMVNIKDAPDIGSDRSCRARHKILLVRPDRRTLVEVQLDRQTFASFAPIRELIKYLPVIHHPVTLIIHFLSFNFRGLPSDSKSNKICGHRGFCTLFLLRRIVVEIVCQRQEKICPEMLLQNRSVSNRE